jgi:hypothetical protein
MDFNGWKGRKKGCIEMNGSKVPDLLTDESERPKMVEKKKFERIKFERKKFEGIKFERKMFEYRHFSKKII